MELRITSPYAITKHDNPNIVKDHDFDLAKPILPGVRYVVLTRDFDQCCLSYYRFKKLAFQREESELPYPFVDVASEDYQAFREEAQRYYDGFLQKWVLTCHEAMILPITYRGLLFCPQRTIDCVLRFADW